LLLLLLLLGYIYSRRIRSNFHRSTSDVASQGFSIDRHAVTAVTDNMSGDGGRSNDCRRRRGPLAAADDADQGDVVDDSAWLPSPRAKRRVTTRVVVSWAAEQPDQQLALINAGVTGTLLGRLAK